MTVILSNVIQRWGNGADGSPKANAALFATYLAIATVLRKSMVSDGAGGQTDTYASVGTAACNFERTMRIPREQEQFERIENVAYWDFSFVPGSVDVHATDRLQVGTRTFEVIGRGLGSSTVALHIITMEVL
jgi:hypothetical protein